MPDIPAPIQGAIDEIVRQRDGAQARAISLASELAAAVAEIKKLTSEETTK